MEKESRERERERERERQRGGESLQVWQKQEVGGGFRRSGWERRQRRWASKCIAAKQKAGVAGKKGVSGRRQEKQWVGDRRKERRQTQDRNADSQQRRRRRRRRGEGGGRGGLAWHTERAGAERGRFWIRETDKKRPSWWGDTGSERGRARRQRERRRDRGEQNDGTLSCCTEYDDGTVLSFRLVGECLFFRTLVCVFMCARVRHLPSRVPLNMEEHGEHQKHWHWAWNSTYYYPLTDKDSTWPLSPNGGAAEAFLIGHSLRGSQTANGPPQAPRTARRALEIAQSPLWSDVARCASGHALFARCCCCGICCCGAVLNMKSNHSQKKNAPCHV